MNLRKSSDAESDKGGEFAGVLVWESGSISFSDYRKYGCPVCLSGEKTGFVRIETGDMALMECAKCGVGYIICQDGLVEAPLINGSTKVVAHPLRSRIQ